MPYLVQKFGGTSVADLAHIQKIIPHIRQAYNQGYQVVVVVSAMAGTTNQLVKWVQEACAFGSLQEYDVVASAGEQITAGLVALALQNNGLKARSWLGWQIPIITSQGHGQARVLTVETKALKSSLLEGNIAVVAGFQGLSRSGRVTTLGRGGSDTTAVALASFLKAERCDIYTDVEGVYTADPRLVQQAQKLHHISYEEMLALASNGAKVLHAEAVMFAQEHQIPLRVLSSFSGASGTLVEGKGCSGRMVSGITSILSMTQWTIQHQEDWDHIGQNLKKEGIPVDMITHWFDIPKRQHHTFFIAAPQYKNPLRDVFKKLNLENVQENKNRATISLIKGQAGRQAPQVRQTMLETLLKNKIRIYGLSTSPLKISALVDHTSASQAVACLHEAYSLGQSQKIV